MSIWWLIPDWQIHWQTSRSTILLAHSSSMDSAQDAPRAYLDGPFDIPVDHKIPDLALVRDQAAKGDLQCTLSDSSKSYSDLRQWTVTGLMQAPIPPRLPAFNVRGEPLGLLPPAFWYNSMCPHLFQFGYLCFVEDSKFHCISRYISFSYSI